MPAVLDDDVSLVKVTVKPRNRSRSRSRSRSRARSSERRQQQYVLHGKHNSVFLQFEQQRSMDPFGSGGGRGGFISRKDRMAGVGAGTAKGNYVHRNASNGGKRLGNVMGMTEFKNKAREKTRMKQSTKQSTGAHEEDPVDHELAQEIDFLRQIQFDKDRGYVEMDGDDDGAHKDDRWFRLEQNMIGKDFYQEFLKSVKCTAYATDRDREDGEAWGVCTARSMACTGDNIPGKVTMPIDAALDSRDEEPILQVASESESYNLQNSDANHVGELRELEEYRLRQEEIDREEELEMARIQMEEIEKHDQTSGKMTKSSTSGKNNQNQKALEELNTELLADNVDERSVTVDQEVIERVDKQQPTDSRANSVLDSFNRMVATLDEYRKDVIQKVSQHVKCGEDLELLDFFKDANEPTHVPIGVEEERRTLYHANEHEDLPPTALYAAIGTQNWNIALMRLLEEPREASKWVKNVSTDGKTEFRFLPLHIACLSGAPLLLITLLVQTYPNAVKYNAMGKLPIHLACETLADHRVVFLLLNAWPESINVRDDNGMIPIQVASLNAPCDERKRIVQVLTKKMECSVVKVPTSLYAAIDSQNWNSAMMRLVEIPQEATTWVSFTKKNMEVRFLPLHIACLLGAPYFLVHDLVHAYPDAVKKKTTLGDLPLHIACQHHSDERVVELLLNSWPESLFVKDDAGNSALEVAAATEFSPERTAILALLQKKLDHQDKIVYAPTDLYSLIESKKWDMAVRHCLEIPDEVSTWVGSCAKMKDAKLLPIHVACSLNAPLILVAVLIQTYPDGVKRTNNAGSLPIHLACESRADHRVVSLLLHSWPQSFHEVDDRGYTPVQVALMSQPSAERTKIVETLMAFESKNEKDTLIVTDPMFDQNLNLDDGRVIDYRSIGIETNKQGTDPESNNQTGGHRRGRWKSRRK